MSADQAHVAAVAEALAEAKNADPAPALYVEIVGNDYGWPYYDAHFSDDAARFYATVAVETLTPLIRARVAAEIRAAARDHAYVVGETRDAPATNNPAQRARDEGIQIAYARALLIAEALS